MNKLLCTVCKWDKPLFEYSLPKFIKDIDGDDYMCKECYHKRYKDIFHE